jgi:Spermidine/putrescine-binding periplasmic protein
MKKRNTLILLAVTVLLATGATACSSGKSGSGYAKNITLFNWAEYMPKSVLSAFQKKYDINVKVATYLTNEEMMAKLKSGGTSQYDMAVPSNFFIPQMKQAKFLQKIDKDAIPNLKNISPAFLNRDWDQGNQYSVPYLSSPTTIIVNPKTCKVNIKTYADLLSPKLKGAIVCGLDERGLVGLGLKGLGYSSQETDKAKILESENWLKKLQPNILAYDAANPKSELLSGDASVGLMWSGQAALALQSNPNLKLIWPDGKGIFLSVDNFVLLSTSKHKRECELFMNYLLDSKVSAKISDEFPYLNPNQAAKKYFSKATLSNPACNIPSKYVSSAEWVKNIGNAITYYDQVYQDIKS